MIFDEWSMYWSIYWIVWLPVKVASHVKSNYVWYTILLNKIRLIIIIIIAVTVTIVSERLNLDYNFISQIVQSVVFPAHFIWYYHCAVAFLSHYLLIISSKSRDYLKINDRNSSSSSSIFFVGIWKETKRDDTYTKLIMLCDSDLSQRYESRYELFYFFCDVSHRNSGAYL